MALIASGIAEGVPHTHRVGLHSEPLDTVHTLFERGSARTSWACRSLLATNEDWTLDTRSDHAPLDGDVALVEVDRIGNHSALISADNERMRLYAGDTFLGVFGNRYATDAYEAEVGSTDELHMLTNGGMLGTVLSRHRSVSSPTGVRFRGFPCDENGDRVNLKSRLFVPRRPQRVQPNVVFMVGTGMNSGKTTTAARLVKSLVRRDLRVAACKVTGSVSHRDLLEYRATKPALARDFSDYGFPSTYLGDGEEILSLFQTMIADAERERAEVVVMEIADGLLQRETQMLLRDDRVRPHVAGVVMTATCALSALEGVRRIGETGHHLLAVSGIIGNSPLFEREFRAQCDTPLRSCISNGDGLAETIVEHLPVSVA